MCRADKAESFSELGEDSSPRLGHVRSACNDLAKEL